MNTDAYDKARHHLERASIILEQLGQAAADNALLSPPQAIALLEQAKAEAATGHGWAVLASVRRPTMRDSMAPDQIHFNP
jgi:hypothetical protein